MKFILYTLSAAVSILGLIALGWGQWGFPNAELNRRNVLIFIGAILVAAAALAAFAIRFPA